VHDLFELEIPSTVITATGNYRCYIRGDNIETAILDGEVKGGGMGTPITYTTFDPSTGRIDTGNTTLAKIQIIDIYNMDNHLPLFRTTEERIGKIVSVEDGVITVENDLYLRRCSSGDALQIIVNQG
jgi:hypothetical protein